MNTFVFYDESVYIPDGIGDLAAFRRWVRSDNFPESGRICYLDGDVWVDMSKEQVFSHNQVKTEVGSILAVLAKKEALGSYFADGLFLSNVAANLACGPDGTFVRGQTFKNKKVRLVEGVSEGYLELEGSADMVLEVVSSSSVVKDTETLRELYWRADIPEYWLVDARSDNLEFDIFCHTAQGYVASQKLSGWIESQVFGKWFQLTLGMNDVGHPSYTLAFR